MNLGFHRASGRLSAGPAPTTAFASAVDVTAGSSNECPRGQPENVAGKHHVNLTHPSAAPAHARPNAPRRSAWPGAA